MIDFNEVFKVSFAYKISLIKLKLTLLLLIIFEFIVISLFFNFYINVIILKELVCS
jgi:hypothetical protein